jgi:hypothetical protein
LEESRRARCQSTPLTWHLNATSGVCERVSPATPPPAVPSAITYSSPQRILAKKCGRDTCTPDLCSVTVCAPDAPGTCTSTAGAGNTVHVLADSPGTTCCVSLPYTSRRPSSVDVLEGNLPEGVAGAQQRCTAVKSALQWQQMNFTALPSTQMFMVRHLSLTRPASADTPQRSAL